MMEDLSGKSKEELDEIKSELIKKQCKLGLEINNIDKRKKELNTNYEQIIKDIKQVDIEIKRRKDSEDAKLILTPEISAIEGFELLGEDELSIITKKMDRTDYGYRYPMFNDLDRICKEVIQIKRRYPKWTLTDMSKGGQIDTLPPYIYYRYEYEDEHGSHFDIGGIKFTSI